MTRDEAMNILINSEYGNKGAPWVFDQGDDEVHLRITRFVDAYPYMKGDENFVFFRFSYPLEVIPAIDTPILSIPAVLNVPSLEGMFVMFVNKKTGEISMSGTAPMGIPLYRKHPEWDWDSILKMAGAI